MKLFKISLLLTLIPFFALSQTYVSLDIDPNKAFGIIDNPRTEVQKTGLDFDVEVGHIEKNLGYYIFYGAFFNADYQNFGAGVDYYILKNRQFSLAIGSQFTNILRKYPVGLKSDTAWGNNFGYAGRMVGILWLYDNFGFSGRAQYQRRPDIGIGILEGSVGIRYNF